MRMVMDTDNQRADYLPYAAVAHRLQTGRPLVTVSYAQSLDGCLTLRQGKPAPVSGEASMQITHQLRTAHDAILVGVGTVLADNPRLTTRGVVGDNPRPVVLDSRLRIPTDAALLNNPRGLIIATTERADKGRCAALEATGSTIWVLPPDKEGRVSLTALLDRLGGEVVNSLMVEGGSQVISSFFRERLVDRAVLTIAPVFAAGYHAVRDLTTTDWQSLPRIDGMQVVPVGGDLIVWGDLIR
jgi:riboflavin-specific deaminase-like protein